MAKRFRFRLQVVRKLRKRREDQCRRVVAERFRQIGQARGRIGALTEELHREHQAMRAVAATKTENLGQPQTEAVPVSQALDVTDMVRRHAYLNHLHRSIAEADGRLAHLQVELHREQADLTEASKDLKVIDKLEDRQRARHALVVRRAELAEADEIAAQFARRVAARVAVARAEGDRT